MERSEKLRAEISRVLMFSGSEKPLTDGIVVKRTSSPQTTTSAVTVINGNRILFFQPFPQTHGYTHIFEEIH